MVILEKKIGCCLAMLNYVGFLDGIDFFKKDMKSHVFFFTGWEVDGTSHHAALSTVVPFVGPFLNLGFVSAIYFHIWCFFFKVKTQGPQRAEMLKTSKRCRKRRRFQ